MFDVDNLFDLTKNDFFEDLNDIIAQNQDLKIPNGTKNGLWKRIQEFQNEWKDVRN